jgi:hypothetical protein
VQKNSQDSVVISDEQEVPLRLREIEAKIPGQLWQELLSKLPEEDACELKACVRQMKPSKMRQSRSPRQCRRASQVRRYAAVFICVSPESDGDASGEFRSGTA